MEEKLTAKRAHSTRPIETAATRTVDVYKRQVLKETPMAQIIELTDITAPALDVFARLTEAQLRNKRAPEKGIFIAESPKVIRCALNAGLAPLALLMERRHLSGQGAALIEQCGDIPVYTGDSALLAQLTGFTLSRGILCAMRRPAPLSAEQVCIGAKRIAVLENIVDPTNIGAIFRSAAARCV